MIVIDFILSCCIAAQQEDGEDAAQAHGGKDEQPADTSVDGL